MSASTALWRGCRRTRRWCCAARRGGGVRESFAGFGGCCGLLAFFLQEEVGIVTCIRSRISGGSLVSLAVADILRLVVTAALG
jgi:hypothetical protein